MLRWDVRMLAGAEIVSIFWFTALRSLLPVVRVALCIDVHGCNLELRRVCSCLVPSFVFAVCLTVAPARHLLLHVCASFQTNTHFIFSVALKHRRSNCDFQTRG